MKLKMPGEKKHYGAWLILIIVIIIIIYILWKRPDLLDAVKSLVFK